jgi:hypothetical protein
MKNLVILIICFFIHSFGYTQIITNIDEISPFHDDLSAIKKGDHWAFINKKGVTVIGFRDDLVSSESLKIPVNYPQFREGRCIIRKLIDGVYYYGYINKNGEEIIPVQYLNVTNFKSGYAIVINLEKKVIGVNKVLGKDVVTHTLIEYIIDTSGKIVKQLDNSRNYVASKYKNNKPPSFYSKFIAPHLISVKTTDQQKYNIYKF